MPKRARKRLYMLILYIAIILVSLLTILYKAGIIGYNEDAISLNLQVLAKSGNPEKLFDLYCNLPERLRVLNLSTASHAVIFSRSKRMRNALEAIDTMIDNVKKSFPNGDVKNEAIKNCYH